VAWARASFAVNDYPNLPLAGRGQMRPFNCQGHNLFEKMRLGR
jgi:hypothetical protein